MDKLKQKGKDLYSKANFQVLEQERNLLKITLEYIAKENTTLKQQLEDMKMTVKHNKEQLREYIETITSKDKVVEKMNSTIEQLTIRLQSLEEHIKKYNKFKSSKSVDISLISNNRFDKSDRSHTTFNKKVITKVEVTTNVTTNATNYKEVSDIYLISVLL
jgi:chromosome segregation ATPase